MDKQDYLRMFEDGHKETDSFNGEGRTSKLDYLANHIFDFTTYESEMSELFAIKAIEVCGAISDRKTFEYIDSNNDNRIWYLLMCNMPFFSERLEWGTSIRGAWWSHPMKLDTCGLFWKGNQIIETMNFTEIEWEQFIEAVREFS